jgi:ferritin
MVTKKRTQKVYGKLPKLNSKVFARYVSDWMTTKELRHFAKYVDKVAKEENYTQVEIGFEYDEDVGGYIQAWGNKPVNQPEKEYNGNKEADT